MYEIKTEQFLNRCSNMDRMNEHLWLLKYAITHAPLKEKLDIIESIILDDRLAKKTDGYRSDKLINEVRQNLLNSNEVHYKSYMIYVNRYINDIGVNLKFQSDFLKKTLDLTKYPRDLYLGMALHKKIKTVEDYKGFYANLYVEFKEQWNDLVNLLNVEFSHYYNLFGERVEISNNLNNYPKLNWKGQKNQIYSIMRQLKNDYALTTDSYNHIAEFIKQSFTGFENTGKETIEKELKKTAPLPHKKRIRINPNENELK